MFVKIASILSSAFNIIIKCINNNHGRWSGMPGGDGDMGGGGGGGSSQSPTDTFQWWNPADWFGQHDEESWFKKEEENMRLRGAQSIPDDGRRPSQPTTGGGSSDGRWSGMPSWDGGMGGGGGGTPSWGQDVLGYFSAPEFSNFQGPGYDEQSFLNDLDTYRNSFDQRGSDIEGLARDQRNAPSVVDEQLKKAYAREQASLANAYAGRSGAGYLENFDQQRSLQHQRLADEGSSLRLQEDLGRQEQLTNVLGQLQGRDQSQQQLLGNIHQAGQGMSLDKYKTDLSRDLGLLGHQSNLLGLANQKYSTDQGYQLGLLGHQTDLSDLELRDKYYGLALGNYDRDDPYSGQNILTNLLSTLGNVRNDDGEGLIQQGVNWWNNRGNNDDDENASSPWNIAPGGEVTA